MIVAVICERMGWGYDTYVAQPKWFTDMLISKYDIDARNSKRERNAVQ